MATWDFIQKQVLLGDAGTGKSSLLVRLTDDRFLQHSEPTIGVEFGSRLVTVDDGGKDKTVKLQIWDTAGQETFRSITRSYYRGAGGALLVFSLAERSSFVACKGWLDDLRAWGEEDVVVLLVGNKGDLDGSAREVEEGEAREWAQEMGLAGYVETSAKSGNGVEEAFNALTRTVHAKQQAALVANAAARRRKSGTISLGLGSGSSGSCC